MITSHEEGDNRAKILAWHKRVGDLVEEGDELFTYALPSGNYLAVSEQTGRLAAIYLPAGESAAVPVDVALLSAVDAKSALAFMPDLPKENDEPLPEQDDDLPPWEEPTNETEQAEAETAREEEAAEEQTPWEDGAEPEDEAEPAAEYEEEWPEAEPAEAPWDMPVPAEEAESTPPEPVRTEEAESAEPLAQTEEDAEPEVAPAEPEIPAAAFLSREEEPRPAEDTAPPAAMPVSAPLYVEKFDAHSFCALVESLRLAQSLCGGLAVSSRALLAYACIQIDAKTLGLVDWKGLSLPEIEEYLEADMPGAQAVLTSELCLAAPSRPDGATLCMGRAEKEAWLCLTGCEMQAAERFLPRLREYLENIGTRLAQRKNT